MVICSACGEEKDQQYFSKVQRKRKAGDRRCKACIAQHASGADAQEGTRNRHPLFNEKMVKSLVHRYTKEQDRFEFLPSHLQDPEKLEAIFRRIILESEFVKIVPGFAEIILKGLLLGGQEINKTIDTDGRNKVSILCFVCGWAQYKPELKWHGDDDMVDIVFATPGLRVNDVMPNGTNAIHHSVKYGTARTIRRLLEAGVNVHQKDEFGQTALKNAIEQCHPEIVSILLQHLPPTEILPSNQGTLLLSAPDRIVLYQIEDPPPISWLVIGRPSIDNVIECLYLLRIKGAKFTKAARQAIKSFGVLGCDPTSLIDKERRAEFCKLAKALMGHHLPPCAFDALEASTKENTKKYEEEPIDCPICQKPLKKPLTLFCRHTFCRQCIVKYGQSENNHSCPTCHNSLCLDLNTDYIVEGNVANEDVMLGVAHQIGFTHLTDSQITEEAKADGFFVNGISPIVLRAEFFRRNKRIQETSRNDMSFTLNATDATRHRAVHSLELQSSGTVLVNNVALSCPEKLVNNVALSCPEHGPVVVEISIAGVPVLAHVSNNTRYTMVAKSVADAFGLKRIDELTTNKMRDFLSVNRLKHLTFTCLEDFQFELGNTTVHLRNAMQVQQDFHGIGKFPPDMTNSPS
jgi:hypothetical protein